MVRVLGTGFYPTQGLRAFFGSLTVPCTYVSYTEINCVSPPTTSSIDAPFEVILNVTQDSPLNEMRLYTSKNASFTYYETYSLQLLTPPAGQAAAAGLEVAIFGSNLTDTRANGVEEVSASFGGAVSLNAHSTMYKRVVSVTASSA